jgi:hypothetical protein
MTQHGDRAGDEQTADIFVTALAGAPQPLLTAARVLPQCYSQAASRELSA